VIIKKKKKKVLALFGHPHLSITQVRCASFKETFKRLAPETEIDIFYPENIAGAEELVLSLLKQGKKYDVIFCMGDLILIGAMHAVHELDLKIPDEIGIISISNGLIPTMYKPKITHVETSGSKLGKLAFTQMFSRLKEQTIAEEVFLESVLVEGGSL
jgi:LacI family transcriptional regulator